jgi:hypothetical protein
MKKTICWIWLGLFSVTAAYSETSKCRLTVRTTFKSGKKKIDVMEVEASSREECKQIAKEKELVNDEEIEKIKVSFGYR